MGDADAVAEDPFTLMAGMCTESMCKVEYPGMHEVDNMQSSPDANHHGHAVMKLQMDDAKDAEQFLSVRRAAPWEHYGTTPVLVDSLSRQLMRLRSQGFEMPWTCSVCCLDNMNWFSSCESCKGCNERYSASMVADITSLAGSRADSEDHILLVLARAKGPCKVEACFALCEAMAREICNPAEATRHYRRAFRLWPELDSSLCIDGVPVRLRADADAILASRGALSVWDLTQGSSVPRDVCPILGPCRADWEASLSGQASSLEKQLRERLLDTFDIEGVARYMTNSGAHRIVVMCGAGISTSAGIPDFRSPGTGLYANLQKYNLPTPEAIFTLDHFRHNPGAFYELAREMWPDNFIPTPCHYFIRLLHEKGLLLRCYSQNIDSLERRAGLPAEKLVAVHGNFDDAHVIDTQPEVAVDIVELKAAIDRGEEGWKELCKRKGGLVKPTLVFFGESLPKRFCDLYLHDLNACDLLLVLGTSLVVAPFNSLVGKANPSAPRLLINREPIGLCENLLGGFQFHLQGEGANWRDAFYEGNTDDGVLALASALGWSTDLAALIASGCQRSH
mmetsp:Transcript_121071/g.270652  ORF Transcript_121071/g.270652 Transcript_121071/m.270652 type:complete len:564 (+) Transcript_121071:68-1759(+)